MPPRLFQLLERFALGARRIAPSTYELRRRNRVAGTPTFKRFKRRQQYLSNVVQTLLSTVITIRRKSRSDLPLRTDIHILTPDITEKDNASLAIAVQRIVTAFAPHYNAKLIEPKEFVRFVAETMPDAVGDFVPVNVRGGASKLPNADPDDPKKDDLNSP